MLALLSSCKMITITILNSTMGHYTGIHAINLRLLLDFYIRPPALFQLILLLGSSSNVPEASTTRFATYHLHYKDKVVNNPTRTFICTAICLLFGYSLASLGNLSTASLFVCDGGACATEPGLITKKGEPPRTSLHLFSNVFQPPSLLLSSTLSEIRLAISGYLTMSKCAAMCKWQPSLALTSLPLLADNASVKLTSEASLNLSYAAQTVEFLPVDNIQKDVSLAYHGTVHLHKHNIQAYTSGLVNNLHTSIVNYEVAYKPIKESYLNKKEDDELFFTDCQY